MNSFKRCATAVALVMTGTVPALAQELPETVVLAVEGTTTGYRVPVSLAAELCGDVPAETLAAIAEDADVIYCSIAETVVVERGFETTPEIELLADLNSDDSGDDGEDDDGDGNDSDDDENDNDLLDGDQDGEGTDDSSDDGSDDSSGDDASGDDASGDDSTDDGSSDDEGSEEEANDEDDGLADDVDGDSEEDGSEGAEGTDE
jgi:hypothetical protein